MKNPAMVDGGRGEAESTACPDLGDPERLYYMTATALSMRFRASSMSARECDAETP